CRRVRGNFSAPGYIRAETRAGARRDKGRRRSGGGCRRGAGPRGHRCCRGGRVRECGARFAGARVHDRRRREATAARRGRRRGGTAARRRQNKKRRCAAGSSSALPRRRRRCFPGWSRPWLYSKTALTPPKFKSAQGKDACLEGEKPRRDHGDENLGADQVDQQTRPDTERLRLAGRKQERKDGKNPQVGEKGEHHADQRFLVRQAAADGKDQDEGGGVEKGVHAEKGVVAEVQQRLAGVGQQAGEEHGNESAGKIKPQGREDDGEAAGKKIHMPGRHDVVELRDEQGEQRKRKKGEEDTHGGQFPAGAGLASSSGSSGTRTVTSVSSARRASSRTSPVLKRPSVLGSARTSVPMMSPGGKTPSRPELTS